MEKSNLRDHKLVEERIKRLRERIKIHGLNGYIIPSNDEYLNEYVPEYAKRLQYITGFTGSNGLAVILEKNALFFTDGRYLTQSLYELNSAIFQIFDQKDFSNFVWTDFILEHHKIGYDPKLFTKKMLKNFVNIGLFPTELSLVDEIWSEQPAKPSSSIYLYSSEFTGEEYSSKIKKCRDFLEKNDAQAIILTASDSICWLLNLRASDVEFSPLMLANMIITKEQCYLFIDPKRIDEEIKRQRQEIIILAEDLLAETISNILGKVLIDENFASSFVMTLLENKEFQSVSEPCQLWKATKNQIEIAHNIEVHIKDAVAVCELLAYIKNAKNLSEHTEYDLAVQLTKNRSLQHGYVTDSFPTICGFQENSAIIHYRANRENAKYIKDSGILLIDSGGQYLGATTDITRTIAVGEANEEQKKLYTQVLKGHIALSKIKFPKNTTGANLDILARQFLWADCKDYPHGTGHGVGNFLNVHEGPMSINLRNNVPLQLGMVLSNEPGYYLPKSFGIRIENLFYVKEVDGNNNYYEFETLTLVPYEKSLIDLKMLNRDEIEYIILYYKKIHKLVYPLLSATAQEWFLSQRLS